MHSGAPERPPLRRSEVPERDRAPPAPDSTQPRSVELLEHFGLATIRSAATDRSGVRRVEMRKLQTPEPERRDRPGLSPELCSTERPCSRAEHRVALQTRAGGSPVS